MIKFNKAVKNKRRIKCSINRAETLVDVTHHSARKPGGRGAVMEIQMLLEDHKVKKQQLEMVASVVEELTIRIPNVEKMLSVDSVALVTVAGLISEVGDISRFKNLKQIQKHANHIVLRDIKKSELETNIIMQILKLQLKMIIVVILCEYYLSVILLL